MTTKLKYNVVGRIFKTLNIQILPVLVSEAGQNTSDIPPTGPKPLFSPAGRAFKGSPSALPGAFVWIRFPDSSF